jgi:DNA-binding GntR family transcriptional regulator
MLVENQIQPGAKLNERALCEGLNVSRTPLREAIKTLAAEGLVELLPNRGAVAASLNLEDVVHTFEVMACLEAQSGWLAAERITDQELAEIKALHFEMMAAFTRRDLSNYYRLNAAIHRAINAAAKNPILTATYEQVNARLQALRFKSNQDEEKWKCAVKEHEQMIDALDKKGIQTVRLKKILVNLRNMTQRVEKMYTYHQAKTNISDTRKNEIHSLATHQHLNWQIFRENLTFQSSVFRHSFRVAIVCLIAFIFARNFYTGQFSYWILLTILVILKPAFSQTKLTLLSSSGKFKLESHTPFFSRSTS